MAFQVRASGYTQDFRAASRYSTPILYTDARFADVDDLPSPVILDLCTVLPHIGVVKATTMSTKICGPAIQVDTTHDKLGSPDPGGEYGDDSDGNCIPSGSKKDPSGEYGDNSDGSYIPSGSKKRDEGMWQGMPDAMDEMNLRLMRLCGTTPEEMLQKQQNEEQLREQEASRMKVLECMENIPDATPVKSVTMSRIL
ncbi:hypothetical protein BJV78DRAFT_1282808 [Lactifluus subvellereus]|nr:hypothetical protein BJV78DRAFT_1282808 [Lactifluus subvellereus]